ncbi:MAG: amino acid permease [Cyanobacteria bacterium P01_C01_bin.89]
MKTPAAPGPNSDAVVLTKGTGLGTFGGVYTPSILTILGVIMYLRFGWVVGNVGLLGSLAIVTLASAITFLTSLSICTIATDRVVRTGGAYYMISRSLGIEAGGAVGVPLYFAQAISVALYTIGFAESVVGVFPNLNQQYVAFVTTVAVAILALTSASLAIRAQYFIMAAIAISLVCFIFGPTLPTVEVALWTSDREPFWGVFAVFFPAVTGIMAGVNLSGDLADPVRSIPKGTLAATITGYIIYMILPLLFAFKANPDALINDTSIMETLSLWSPAILMGIWGATLSSAIGSILGAPRVLQALARDGVLPNWMRFVGKGRGADDEPRIGTWVTLVVALGAVALNDLDLIAPVLSMFFLTTYLVLNVVALIEGFLQSPSFRPSFRVNWIWSLLGGVGCLAVMFLIDSVATVVAAVLVLGLYFWLQRRELETAWGDVRRGLWMALLRAGLYQIGNDDPKNWRPNLLVMSGAPNRRWALIQLANDLTHNRGIVTICSVLPRGSRGDEQRASVEQLLRDYLYKRNVQALVRVVTAADPFVGAHQLVEAYGLGKLVPNTVVLGSSENQERRSQYCELIRKIHEGERSLIVLRDGARDGSDDGENGGDRPDEIPTFGRRERIDIWWGGLQNNGGLMVLLAYLLRTDLKWQRARIVLKLMVPNDAAAEAAQGNLDTLVGQLRMDLESQILIGGDRAFPEVLHESSAGADLVMLGLASPMADYFDTPEAYADYYSKFQRNTADLPTTLFVLAAPKFDFSKVLVDQ